MPEITTFIDPHDTTLEWGRSDDHLVFRRSADTAWTATGLCAFQLTPPRVALWNALLNRAAPPQPDVLRPIADALGLDSVDDVPDVVRQEHAALIAYRNAAWGALRALGVAWGDDATMAAKLNALVPTVEAARRLADRFREPGDGALDRLGDQLSTLAVERTALRDAVAEALGILGYTSTYARYEVLCERLIEHVGYAKSLADNHVQLDDAPLRALSIALTDLSAKLGIIRPVDNMRALHAIGDVALRWKVNARKYDRVRAVFDDTDDT